MFIYFLNKLKLTFNINLPPHILPPPLHLILKDILRLILIQSPPHYCRYMASTNLWQKLHLYKKLSWQEILFTYLKNVYTGLPSLDDT